MKNLPKPAVLIFALGLGWGVLSCNQEKKEVATSPVEQPPVDQKPAVSLDSIEYTILPYDTTKRLLPFRSVPASLSKVEVAEAERQLQDFINIMNNQKWKNKKAQIRLRDYKRQYLAATLHGQKLVYINALCHAPTPTDGGDSTVWKTRFLTVDNGGKCYFQITINIDQKNVMAFHMNDAS